MRSMDVSGLLCVYAVGNHMLSYIGAHPSSLWLIASSARLKKYLTRSAVTRR